MLLRLLLTLSLLGAWSLPVFGCIKPITTADLWNYFFIKHSITKTIGGGTWHDSKGNEGTFSSKLYRYHHSNHVEHRAEHGLVRVKRVGGPTIYSYIYSIKLDDKRTEKFIWQSYYHYMNKISKTPSLSSSSSEYAMGFFARATDAKDHQMRITVDGDYTLTIVEEKLDNVLLPLLPSRITYKPRSSLHPDSNTNRIENLLLNFVDDLTTKSRQCHY